MAFNSYDAYILFRAVNIHMSTYDYDIISYNYKANGISIEAFQNNRIRFYFDKVVKNYHANFDKILQYYISNVLAIGTGKPIDQYSNDHYLSWKGRMDRFQSNVIDDCGLIMKKVDGNFQRAIEGDIPLVFDWYLISEISPETLTIINHMTKCIRNMKPNPLFTERVVMIDKYISFLKVNETTLVNDMEKVFKG